MEKQVTSPDPAWITWRRETLAKQTRLLYEAGFSGEKMPSVQELSSLGFPDVAAKVEEALYVLQDAYRLLAEKNK